jgi:hypothetical protein
VTSAWCHHRDQRAAAADCIEPHNRCRERIAAAVLQAEVGACINSIRSSLDVLATVLVKRHSLQIHEDRVFFPIARSKEVFERPGGAAQKFLERLPELERKLMNHLQPYQGGNPALWALHHFDIVRKHRCLPNARLRPIHMSIQGTLAEGDFTPR